MGAVTSGYFCHLKPAYEAAVVTRICCRLTLALLQHISQRHSCSWAKLAEMAGFPCKLSLG